MLHHTYIGSELSSGMVYSLTLQQKGPCTSKLRVLAVQKDAAVLVLFLQQYPTSSDTRIRSKIEQ